MAFVAKPNLMLFGDLCVGQDVAEGNPMLGQHFADEQSPMAALRPPLATHQCNPMVGGSGEEPRDRLLETRLLSHTLVKRVAVLVVVIGARRPTAELLAQEEVANAHLLQPTLDLVPVELGREARVGKRADVHDDLDRLAAQEPSKRVELVIGVTDGPDGRRLTHHRNVSQVHGWAGPAPVPWRRRASNLSRAVRP